jgi:nicotinamide phosphoribosyltransferase
MENNIIIPAMLDTDSYKMSHWKQYPENTTYMQSYLESRVGSEFDEVVFFGLQYIMKKYLTQKITMEMVEEAEQFANAHGEPFNSEGWRYIVNELDGKLPIRIRAVPEGTVVPIDNVLMLVESTDEKVFWVVSWFETILMRIWYPITVATLSRHCKEVIMGYLEKTSDDPQSEIDFKLHDFGSRGSTSQESAMIGGAAHLVNFKGSDTIAGVYMANKYYNHDMAGFSIPAAEHSTITAYGENGELKAYENMLNQYAKKDSIVAIVSDSWDIENAINNMWGTALKQKVIDSGATVVIRPDSGDPESVVFKCLQLLDKYYGHTINSKGYKVLNHVRVIQGDGIDRHSLWRILETITQHDYSTSNLAFGMGAGLLQKNLDRDTQRFAFKCCVMKINGKFVNIHKNPASDPTKKSKSGFMDLVADGNSFKTIGHPSDRKSLLKTVYVNGEITREYDFDQVRGRAKGDILTWED